MCSAWPSAVLKVAFSVQLVVQGERGIVHAVYYKSGHTLVARLQSIYAKALALPSYLHRTYDSTRIRMDGNDRCFVLGKFWNKALNLSHGLHNIGNPSSDWPLPSRIRMIHWYRDPAAMIVSAYRYHTSNQSMYDEQGWNIFPCTCHYCDEAVLAAMFKICKYSCTYFELLGSMNEKDGVLTEASSRVTLMRHMAMNLLRWAPHSNVLHLSVEQVRFNFNATMKCMMRFMGIRMGARQDLLLEDLQELDQSRLGAQSELHSTSGKHDNTYLRQVLETHSSWGSDLVPVRAVASEVVCMEL
eukprot:gnl/TRDRNA2_/TRDRNA2_161971_c0_seq4.p1 gnl/TRDRNA2_/TRDRNA2_161971_c0~~gnl/TRDRNA2_/TRDRNA2_161971_c0_seq4.p1  ORF type:complete len:300 (+),score=34.22 gnl/TRDRNA2_/TRDRNA2_161971_c0_seq4:61-960(+)